MELDANVSAAHALLFAVIATGTALWGYLGWLVIVWVACMVLDYATGSAVAMKQGEWSSGKAREGLWGKMGMIVAVIVAALGDIVLEVVMTNIGIQLPAPVSALLSPVVMSWYTLTELGSIAENAVEMGAKVPAWLLRILKVSAKAIEQAGETAAGGSEEVEHDTDSNH